MAMADPDRGVGVKSLYGGHFIRPEVAQRSMAVLGQRLTTEFKERAKLRAELAEQMRLYRSPLVEVISKDKRASEAISGLRRLYTAAHDRKRRAPHPTKAKERIFAGSIGATLVPPYDYQWTWTAVDGNPLTNTETADNLFGNMSFSIWTDLNNNSSISGRTAVGIYFYPPVANGSLQIWSTPAFTDDWGTFCGEASASADAWIGLYVASSDLTGADTGAVVDQQVQLWSDSSWWSGTGYQQGSNSGFGLYAPPIQVDQDHQYAIWVWAGGDVSADGFGTFFGSGAGDDLSVAVPSITWELG
jgi:hypothetical protein